LMRPLFSESVSGMRHEDPNEAFERAMAENGRGGWDQVLAMVGALVLFGLLLVILLVIRGGIEVREPVWQFEGVRLVPGAFGIRIDETSPLHEEYRKLQPAFAPMKQERTFDRR